MILPTFTEKEFEKEFFEDLKNVLRYMEYKKRKFQKAIRSANHFPIKTKFIDNPNFSHIKVTKRNNSINEFFVTNNKK